MAQVVENPPAMQEMQVQSLSWRREWQPTPVFLPGKFHGQRSLAGSSPQSMELQSDTTEQLSTTTTVKPSKLCCFFGHTMWHVGS